MGRLSALHRDHAELVIYHSAGFIHAEVGRDQPGGVLELSLPAFYFPDNRSYHRLRSGIRSQGALAYRGEGQRVVAFAKSNRAALGEPFVTRHADLGFEVSESSFGRNESAFDAIRSHYRFERTTGGAGSRFHDACLRTGRCGPFELHAKDDLTHGSTVC